MSGPLRILVIEDDPDDQAILCSLLEQSGRALSLAREKMLTLALRRLAAEPFDLVFLDLSLPDSWGLETLRRLRKSFSDMPVVLMTGAVMPELAAEATAEGALDCLFKHDLDGQRLGALLDRFCGGE